MPCGARCCGIGVVGGQCGVAAAQAASNGRARLGIGGAGHAAEGTRGAHLEHGAHVLDAGRVEAQRLVERTRELPSQEEGMHYAG